MALMRNGFKAGSPLLDLSGMSPGLVYALDGRAIGNAWMIGGYKGSNALARASIAKIPCTDLQSSWLIVEPGGPVSLDLSMLKDFEIDIQDESRYEKVAHLITPKVTGPCVYPCRGFRHHRHQFVYKPLL